MLPADILARLDGGRPDTRRPARRRGRGRPAGQFSNRDRAIVEAVRYLIGAGCSQREAFRHIAKLVRRTPKAIESVWRKRRKIEGGLAERTAAAALAELAGALRQHRVGALKRLRRAHIDFFRHFG